MSYPSIEIYGPEGEQYNTYAAASQRWPFGTALRAQDGRMYRFARAGGATLVIGDLLTAAANVAAATCSRVDCAKSPSAMPRGIAR